MIVCSPGRNFVTLKIETEGGLYGLGDATLNGRELAVASYLTDHLIPLLIGRDARRIEDIWHYLYKGAYWRRGPVTMTAIAAVDTALWDIKGKALGVPVYQLLGGQARDDVMVYGHANGETIEETVAAAAEYVRLGYKAVRLQCGVPGVPNAYGIARGKLHYEPAEKGKPLETFFSTEQYLNVVPSLFARARSELGPDLHLLHDVHHRLTPIEAARLGQGARALSPVLDGGPGARRAAGQLPPDPPAHDHAAGGGRGVRVDSRLPAADRGAADRLHPHDGRARGRHHAPARASRTSPSCTTCAPAAHGATDLSPVCMAAALHFDLAVHNFGIQEYMRHTRRDRPRLPARVQVRRRRAAPGRGARAGRRHRRGAGREVSVRSRLPADGAQAGRHRAQLVT